MEISDYEQYYQKGGTYVLPIEVFNELWGEMENWKDTCKQKENIIKELREKIHDIYFRIDNIPQNHWIGIKLDVTNQGQELLKILDKVEENKQMTAKEMFEKLNYFKSTEDFEDELVYNLNSEDIENYRYISFHKIFRYIEVDDWTDNFQLSIQELQAINKQVEELGWNK